MAEIHAPTGSRERTETLIVQIVGGERGIQLRAQLARRYPRVRRELVEEAFQDACARAEVGCDGQTEGEVFSWLRTVALRELSRQEQRVRREVLVDPSHNVFEGVDRDPLQVTAEPDDPEARWVETEERGELEALARAVLARLSDRQRDVAALHVRGRRRPEIARHLGMTQRTVKRQFEQIMALGRAEVLRFAGPGCEAGEEVVARFAFGLANRRQVREAQLHLLGCEPCGAMFERLEAWREKVAALVPLPAVQQVHVDLAPRVGHHAAEVLLGTKQRVVSGVGGLRQQLSGATAQVRQHASAGYYRTVDPTPLAAVRPGAAAAAIAGCLAVGGGATYCLTAHLDPLGGVRQVFGSGPARAHKHAAPRKARAAEVPAPPVVTTPAEPTTVAPGPAPAPRRSSPPPLKSAPQDEFQPTSPGGTGASSQRASASASRPAATPAPVPKSAPAEFGP
jgi:RNA polymerase sigma factor (sigma-70 family)